MKTKIVNTSGTDWSCEIQEVIQTTLEKLQSIPNVSQYLPHLRQIFIMRNHFETGQQQHVLGSYNHSGIIRIFANKIGSIPEAIYVFLHELGHHVAEKRTGIDSDYNSKEMNNAYYKEEMRADALAIMLMKKFFNQDGALKMVIRKAKNRLDYFMKKFKGISTEPTYEYTITWKVDMIGWNTSKTIWNRLALAA